MSDELTYEQERLTTWEEAHFPAGLPENVSEALHSLVAELMGYSYDQGMSDQSQVDNHLQAERDQWKKNHDTLKRLTDEDLSRLTHRLAEAERRADVAEAELDEVGAKNVQLIDAAKEFYNATVGNGPHTPGRQGPGPVHIRSDDKGAIERANAASDQLEAVLNLPLRGVERRIRAMEDLVRHAPTLRDDNHEICVDPRERCSACLALDAVKGASS